MSNHFRYSQTAQRQSKLVSDRPLGAQETAVYWVEYVIRHRGAPHMHYPGADQNFLQQNSIDVIALFLFVLYVVFKIIKIFFKFIWNKCCSRKEKKSKIN